MEKIYRILKRYPGLHESFQPGDIVYRYNLDGDRSTTYNIVFDLTVYKKPFSQGKDPWICSDHIGETEFFEEIDESRVTIKISE